MSKLIRKQMLQCVLALIAAFLLFGTTTTFVVSQPASAHDSTTRGAYSTCITTLTPVDLAPGDWVDEHNKLLYARGTSTDVADLYNRGLASVSYSDQNYNVGEVFQKGVWGIDTQSRNQWGIRTRWTWLHQNFTSYHWIAMWESSSAPCGY